MIKKIKKILIIAMVLLLTYKLLSFFMTDYHTFNDENDLEINLEIQASWGLGQAAFTYIELNLLNKNRGIEKTFEFKSERPYYNFYVGHAEFDGKIRKILLVYNTFYCDITNVYDYNSLEEINYLSEYGHQDESVRNRKIKENVYTSMYSSVTGKFYEVLPTAKTKGELLKQIKNDPFKIINQSNKDCENLVKIAN